MTLTEWKKAQRVLASDRDFTADNGTEIRKHQGRYGAEYSVHVPGAGCIMVEYDLLKVKEILVDSRR